MSIFSLNCVSRFWQCSTGGSGNLVPGDKEFFWAGFEAIHEPYAFSKWYAGNIGVLNNNLTCEEFFTLMKKELLFGGKVDSRMLKKDLQSLTLYYFSCTLNILMMEEQLMNYCRVSRFQPSLLVKASPIRVFKQ